MTASSVTVTLVDPALILLNCKSISTFPSNIGTAGVGVFDGKVGVDLQFRNINSGSNKVTITDDAANNEIEIDIVDANIDHDSLLNFVTNEHIDHSAVSINSGVGLTGGGDITATRTIDLDVNGLTAEPTPVGADELVVFDVSAAAHRKITICLLYTSPSPRDRG